MDPNTPLPIAQAAGTSQPARSDNPLLASLIACAVITFLLCQRYAGFILFLLAVPLVPWLLYSAWIALVRPNLRHILLLKMGIWLGGVAIVLGVNYYMFVTARSHAQRAVSAIETFIVTHGACPANTEVIGITKAELHAKLGRRFVYVCSGNKPRFFYGTTFALFDTEEYDFEQHRWVHVND